MGPHTVGRRQAVPARSGGEVFGAVPVGPPRSGRVAGRNISIERRRAHDPDDAGRRRAGEDQENRRLKIKRVSANNNFSQ